MYKLDSHLYQLIKKKQFWTRDVKNATHTLMSGGMISVPDDDIMLFFETLAKDVRNNGYDCLSISEKASKVFRMFLDIDFECETSKLQYIDQIFDSILNIISEITGIDAIMVILTRNWAKKKDKDYKGYHIIFRNLTVDKYLALLLREKLIKRLESIYTEFDWNNIIDINVLKRKHLRMVFSIAYKDQTPIIDNHYYLDKIISKSDVTYPSSLSVLDIIHRSHIRLPQLATINMPTYLKEESKHFKAQTKSQSNHDGIKQRSIDPLYAIPDKYWTNIETIIRNYQWKGNFIYKELIIKSIKEQITFSREEKGFEIKKLYHINVTGPGSKFCVNKQKEHYNATIYFRIIRLNDKIYICQRCYCRCQNLIPERRCSNFVNFLDLINI